MTRSGDDEEGDRPSCPSLGNCTGLQNPWVLPRVFLGYGLGYRILYPKETRTCDTGTWVGGGLMVGKLAQIWT